MSSSSRRFGHRDFPTEMVEEILLRLSTKGVLRCKLLSKTYYDLINCNPRFIDRYTLFHGSSYINKIVTFVKNPESDSIKDLVSMIPCHSDVFVPAPAKLPNIDYLILAGSSNGLLCAQLKELHKPTSSFILWNPTTKEHMILPRPRLDCCSAMGFGYDARSNDYKLVKIRRTESDLDEGLVEFWSRNTNSWKKIESGSALRQTRFTTCQVGVVVREKLYWLASTRSARPYSCPTGTTLMSFDMVNNSFCTQLTLPEVVAQCRIGHITCTIIDFMGSLAVSIRSCTDDDPSMFRLEDPSRFKYDIWVMDDDKMGWTKQLSMGTFRLGVSPTTVYLSGKFLMRQTCRDDWRYFLYDPLTKEEEDLPYKPELDSTLCCFLQPLSYSESLASLN